jgi:anti-sigma B factor antagonist
MNNNEIVPGFDEAKDDSIQIRLQRIDEKCLVLYLVGYIDTYNADVVRSRVEKAVDKGFVKLIFDARQLNYLSSSGVAYFVQLMKTLKLNNGNLVLIYVHPKVHEVLELLGFLQFFEIKESLNEAIDFFSIEPRAWPFIFKCPICDRKLKASKTGKFRCFECKTIIVINPEMQVLLG